jgi:hypothetical protein
MRIVTMILCWFELHNWEEYSKIKGSKYTIKFCRWCGEHRAKEWMVW